MNEMLGDASRLSAVVMSTGHCILPSKALATCQLQQVWLYFKNVSLAFSEFAETNVKNSGMLA
jgi:hypothetical protein